MHPLTIMRLALLIAFMPVSAGAQYANILLMPSEQKSKLANSTVRASWQKLYPIRTIAKAVSQPYRLDYRPHYLSTSFSGRAAIAQAIGEQGVERFAVGQRLKVLLGPHGRSTSRGPDSVYWDRYSGKIKVLEAKGGSSPLKWTYGSRQGTNLNTIRSAGGVLKQTRTSWHEKLQSARVIKAAQRGHLGTGVVRTPHSLGTPRASRQVGSVNYDNVARVARQIERGLVRQNPKLRAVFRLASLQHRTNRLIYHGARWTSGATRFNLVSSAGGALRRFWYIGNRWVLPIGLGVAGANVVNSYFHFATGEISYREFLTTSRGSLIQLTLTGAGAVAGGPLFGIGAIPGAMIGATLAYPIQRALELIENRRYSEFKQAQWDKVDRVVESLYSPNVIPGTVQ